MGKFEKNIKSKANAFEMSPIPGSFDKVMEALEKKKKKRFILWLWIVIPGLLIAGGGIWMLNMDADGFVKSNTVAHNNTTVNYKNTEELEAKKQNKKETYNTTGSTKNDGLNEKEILNKKPTQNNTLQTKKQKSTYTNKTFTNKKQLSNATINSLHTNTNNNVDNNISLVPQHTPQNNVILVPQRNKELFVLGNQSTFNKLPWLNNSLRTNPDFTFKSIKYPPIVFSQNQHRFSLGIYSDLGVSKSIIIDNKNDSNSSTYTQARNQNDIFLFSYSAGLQFRYSPIKNLAIEAGIGFTHYTSNQVVMDANISMSSTDLENYPDTAITLFNTNTISKNYSNVYEYISIPIKLYYQNKWKWIGVEAGGGVIFDIPVHTKSYVANENNGYSYYESTIDNSRLNKFGVQVSANANVVFHFKKIGIFAGPTFKYRVNSMFDDNYIIKQHNYFIGGTIGVRYNF